MNVYIGYDPREPAAYHVLAHSILARASGPLAITPLVQEQLRAVGVYRRGPDTQASTAFSLTRFLVPALSHFEGVSLFLDCDMLCQCDLYRAIHEYMDGRGLPSVYVAKHAYVPRAGVKFLGAAQAIYPRKNWSSVMLFNNARCRALTIEAVNTESPAWLHRFAWASDVGALPLDFNWLVGEYDPKPDARLLHYTLGGPWFAATADCDHADLWRAERTRMMGEGSDAVT